MSLDGRSDFDQKEQTRLQVLNGVLEHQVRVDEAAQVPNFGGRLARKKTSKVEVAFIVKVHDTFTYHNWREKWISH